MTCFGTSASYIAACMKAGVEPGAGRDLSALRSVGSTGSPLSPEGFEWVYEQRRPRHLALLDQRRHRRLHRVRRRRPAAAGLPRRAPGPGARRQGRGVRRGRQLDRRRGGRARDHRADALDAALPVGRRRRLALPRELLRCLPRRLAPRRLDRDHLTRHRRHLRPLRLDDQPPWRPHGDQRDLPRRPGLPEIARRPRRRHPPHRDRGLDAAVRRPRRRRGRSTTSSPPRSSAGSASGARRATSPTPSTRSREVPRTLSGKVLEVPVKRILTGHAARAGGEPRLARQPGVARLLRRAGGHAWPQNSAGGAA